MWMDTAVVALAGMVYAPTLAMVVSAAAVESEAAVEMASAVAAAEVVTSPIRNGAHSLRNLCLRRRSHILNPIHHRHSRHHLCRCIAMKQSSISSS